MHIHIVVMKGSDEKKDTSVFSSVYNKAVKLQILVGNV